jgi:cobalt-zinc-cadmium efflux system protein
MIGTVLNVGFVAVEAGFGFGIQSLALLADAAHNLSDVSGLLIAWGATHLTQQPPTRSYTYGLGRSSILAALLNAMILLIAMGGIAWEAIHRFSAADTIPGALLIGVAGIGVVINGLTAGLFMAGRHHDLNIRGAFLHMAADALISLGVVLTGIALLLTGWYWLDPLISLLIVSVVVYGTWGLFKEALQLSLDRVPNHIEPLAVQMFLNELPGVTQIHDLHIWPMSTTQTALTAHLVMPDGHPDDQFLHHITQELKHHFGIGHATLQVETRQCHQACGSIASVRESASWPTP